LRPQLWQDIVEAVQALVEELAATGESSSIYRYFLQEIRAAQLDSSPLSLFR
jgi:hypothetical protein